MLALVVAKPAMAGTARVIAAGGKVTLEYVALDGETNTVTITQNTGSYTVTDATAPVSAPVGEGCTVAAGVATCADPSTLGAIQAIKVDLGNFDDAVDIDASVRSELLGRAGADNLTGGDGVDFVNGNAGADTINVRGAGRDTVLSCDDPGDAVISDPDDTVAATCTDNNVAPATTVTSGPAPVTNDTTPSFSFAPVLPKENVTGFECMVEPIDDGVFGCGTPFQETAELADGPYVLRVRALDDAPGAGPWTLYGFRVDTTEPQVNVTGPLASTTAQTTFDLSSNETVTFECALDQAAFAACGSPYTTPVLANGSYVMAVRATDAAGNQATAEFSFTVQVTAGGGGGGGGAPNPPVQPRRIIIESLVLISGRAVKMSRKGEVSIGLQCAGTNSCKGRMTITTAEPTKRRSRKLERLGSVKFSIAANKKKNVKVRFSKSKRKLAKRLKRFKAKVVITEVDQRGNARVSSRVFVLRAR